MAGKKKFVIDPCRFLGALGEKDRILLRGLYYFM